jgi:hypothetical protein
VTDIELRIDLPSASELLHLLLDTRVTARAAGVLLRMSALTDDWRGSRNQLSRECCPELGRHAFLYVMQELTKVGYLTVTPSTLTPSGQRGNLNPAPQRAATPARASR